MSSSFVIQFRSSHQYLINYSYLVVDRVTQDAVLIDCSWDYEEVVKYIDIHNICLKKIFLTHSHIDHVVSVEQMVKRYDAETYMSLDEIHYYNYHCSNLIGLEDFQIIKVGGIEVKTVITPGHTRGSTCFEIGKNFFSGDTVFYEGCGVCSGNGADAGMMYDSFQKIKENISESHILYSAHSFGKMPGSVMKKVYKYNIYFNLQDKYSFIKFRMRKNQPIISKFY